MKTAFYGKRIAPATQEIAQAFGVPLAPQPLRGGQGTTYRAGNIVLKPADSDAAAQWMAEVFTDLPESSSVRFARPVRSLHGGWVYRDYAAWTFLEGVNEPGQYDVKLSASWQFHALLRGIEKPAFLTTPASSWAAADLVATSQTPFDYGGEFRKLYDRIAPKLRPLDGPFQPVHGDLSGNFLLHPKLPPAIIDFSPAWAPAGFAEGVMLADAIVWEQASPADLRFWRSIPDIQQLAWRGVIRRIAEQAEHIKFLGKDQSEAVNDALAFHQAIDGISALFP